MTVSDFNERKKLSIKIEHKIAKWVDKKYRTFIPFPRGEDPKDVDVADFISIEGNIFCLNEVKGRTKVFTCREDYPYPALIVMSKDPYDLKVSMHGKPTRFIEVSHDQTALAIIDVCKTEHAWFVSPIPDPTRDYHATECYLCPKELVDFIVPKAL